MKIAKILAVDWKVDLIVYDLCKITSNASTVPLTNHFRAGRGAISGPELMRLMRVLGLRVEQVRVCATQEKCSLVRRNLDYWKCARWCSVRFKYVPSAILLSLKRETSIPFGQVIEPRHSLAGIEILNGHRPIDSPISLP